MATAMKTIHLQYQPSNGLYLDSNTRTMYSKAVVMRMIARGVNVIYHW